MVTSNWNKQRLAEARREWAKVGSALYILPIQSYQLYLVIQVVSTSGIYPDSFGPLCQLSEKS